MLDDPTIAESVLRRSYAFEGIGAAAAVLDDSGLIVETNQAWRLFATLNAARAGTTGPGTDYLAVCDRASSAGLQSAAAVAKGLRGILDGRHNSFELEYPCPSPLEDRWYLLHASAAAVSDGAGIVLFHVDITARKLLEQRLQFELGRDPSLTEPNRCARIEADPAATARIGPAEDQLTLVEVRLHGLDVIGDDFGQPGTEALLAQITARALRAVRAGDHVFQLSGDELIVMCEALDDDGATAIIGRLRHALASPFQLGPTEISLKATIGVTSAGSTLVSALLNGSARNVSSTAAGGLPLGRPAPTASEQAAPDTVDANTRPADRTRAQRDAVLARASDVVLYMEPDGKIAWASPGTRGLFGLSADLLIGRSTFDAIHPDDRERAVAELIAIPGMRDHATSEFRIITDDGTTHWIKDTVTNLLDDPNIGYLVANVQDITERKQLELDLRKHATHDALTGLANRALLVEELDSAIASPAGPAAVAVLLFNIDRFKLINDSVGHDRGDRLLVAIADALHTTLGAHETLARLGGDAFVLVALQLTSPHQALDIAARIRARLAEGLVIGDERYRPTISIGIAIAHDGDTALDTLRDAEIAMYRAKQHGRDGIEWFDPVFHLEVVAAFEIERDLRDAIELDQLYILFQPVLDLQTNRISSCEALVRWHHPRRGNLNPDEFISVAEDTRLIIPLGRWVLERTLAIASKWPDDTQVAVNLSPPELAEPDLVDFVRAALASSAFPATRLVFEITETAVTHDMTAAARSIAALRKLGISVIIDDFGTGYTSLSFLRDFQIDGLKIDRSFVTGLELGSTAIVDAIIRMSAALGLKVIAEGIETTEQLDALRTLGCRYIQGYLVSRPVVPEALNFAPPS